LLRHQIVDHRLHPVDGRRVTGDGRTFHIVGDSTDERDHAMISLHSNVTTCDPGVSADLVLNVCSNLGIAASRRLIASSQARHHG
jgi:hypothetical protein